jgi:hypothetical protein
MSPTTVPPLASQASAVISGLAAASFAFGEGSAAGSSADSPWVGALPESTSTLETLYVFALIAFRTSRFVWRSETGTRGRVLEHGKGSIALGVDCVTDWCWEVR